jgi:hypothetical protein
LTADGESRRKDESEAERLDRNLLELLNELRVVLPGVQVLFAFLLTVPFTQRFSALPAVQEKVYYGVLLCTTLASVLLMAPTAHHRLQFRAQEKRHIVFMATRLSIAGLAFLALAMSGVVYLITDFLFSSTATAIATTATALAFAWVWYGIPLRRMVSDR